eukprot:1062880-Pleurochrysis_carterae.AAC.1
MGRDGGREGCAKWHGGGEVGVNERSDQAKHGISGKRRASACESLQREWRRGAEESARVAACKPARGRARARERVSVRACALCEHARV